MLKQFSTRARNVASDIASFFGFSWAENRLFKFSVAREDCVQHSNQLPTPCPDLALARRIAEREARVA
jgi:hypothetical protein